MTDKKISLFALGIATMLAPNAAQAETLEISGLYPAYSDVANEAQTIAIEPFGGRDGQDLEFALERRLGDVRIFGTPYFDLVSYRSKNDPDALISGSARSSVQEYDVEEYRSRCVKRDEKGKCKKRKSIKVLCAKREITLRTSFKFAHLSQEGPRPYLDDLSRNHEQIICDRGEYFSSEESELQRMTNDIADNIRHILAPRQITQGVRVLESRKGMDKAQKNAFKAAVKMTKSDETEACRMWQELSDSGLSHISLNYNLALCIEQSGDLKNALIAYENVKGEFGKKDEISTSIKRIEDRQQAEADFQRRKEAIAENMQGAILPDATQ